ncbi:MAG: helix-turn-helix transcriptional regulator [Clostridia bacterium]|nr:helix-turn-helix transcriptional regulator [Clostridia bacterium]
MEKRNLQTNKDLNEIISQNIKAEIENSGKSKSEIAKALGVSNPTISQYISGRIQPSLATLSKLCSFLDCSADDILNVKK